VFRISKRIRRQKYTAGYKAPSRPNFRFTIHQQPCEDDGPIEIAVRIRCQINVRRPEQKILQLENSPEQHSGLGNPPLERIYFRHVETASESSTEACLAVIASPALGRETPMKYPAGAVQDGRRLPRLQPPVAKRRAAA